MSVAARPLRVVKIGGRPQGDAALPARVAAAWRAAPGALVVVHGGGDEISALQLALKATPHFVGGRRVTSEQDIDTLRMALSGSANKRLVARLRAEGLPAVGLSGEDAGLLVSRPLDPERYGFVGTPYDVNVDLVRHLLAGGYLPVVSPLSASVEPGQALNVNGDDAAAAIADALDAAELLLVADVPGILAGGAVVRSLTPAEAQRLVADGVATGGMAAKVQAALAALAGGVARVRIGDLAAVEDDTLGTVFTRGTAAASVPSSPTPDRSVA